MRSKLFAARHEKHSSEPRRLTEMTSAIIITDLGNTLKQVRTYGRESRNPVFSYIYIYC